ncbi:MAG: hypothetical protein ACPGWR_18705 [Ardenticatenaceae bacterium]
MEILAVVIVAIASFVSIMARISLYLSKRNSEISPEKEHPNHSDHALADPINSIRTPSHSQLTRPNHANQDMVPSRDYSKTEIKVASKETFFTVSPRLSLIGD